jgi:hypothetical protein
MDFAGVEMPGGIHLEGNGRRDAVLRPLAGRDEAFLLQQGSGLSPAARTTAMLARCICRLGPISTVTTEIARSLSVGDREALLLHLRRLTLGEIMSCVLKCPACGEKLDLALEVSELLLPSYAHACEAHEALVHAGDAWYRARFRLPNGADQEHAAALVAFAPEAATELILRRCVQEIVDEQTGEPAQPIPAAVADALAGKMAELDPQAEILLDLVCPACGASFQTPLDIADYFYEEIRGRESDLHRDVHLLAFHYHWSERDILRLTRRKRMLYLDLLSATLSERKLR